MNFDTKDLITIIGIGLTFLVSAISLYIAIRNSKKTLFINSITASRIKWISDVRDDISEFCGLAYHYVSLRLKGAERQQVLEQIDQLRFRIKLQLNREDTYDKKIIEKIDVISELADRKKIDFLTAEVDELIFLTQDLLKLEWEGAKLESMKGILTKEEKDQLYEKYLKMKKQRDLIN